MTSQAKIGYTDQEFKDLKGRMKLISDSDPEQYHNDHSLSRYLRAFKTVDAAFQVKTIFFFLSFIIIYLMFVFYLIF